MATKLMTAVSKRPPRAVRERIPDTPDAIDIAMAAAVSGRPLPEVARNLLEEQAHLIHAQWQELNMRRIGELVRAALWAILAVAALALVVLFIAILVRASRSDTLIVESFRVPPAMAAQGLTGEVVAKQVLDKVAEFDQSSQSSRSPSSYDNNWGDDLKIDIPQTGATADQIWKLLRGWLGHETRISGEVIQTRDGLALTTRVGSTPGQRFVSKTSDLDSLVSQGAVAIYKNTQPYRSAIYLLSNGREAEGQAMLQTLSTDPSPRERKWAFIGLAYQARTAGNQRYANQLARRALAIDPTMLNALSSVAGTELVLGHAQRAADAYARYVKLPIGSEYEPKIASGSQCGAKQALAWLTRNPPLADESADCLDTAPGAGSAASARATAQVLRHDWQPLAAYREPVNPGYQEVERAASEAEARLYGAMEAGPSPALAQALEDYRRAVAAQGADPKVGRSYEPVQSAYYWPIAAQALAELGRTDEAVALIAKTPLDCYLCVRVRGTIAQAQGNLPEAQRWFYEAARQGPRLAWAFVDWGKLLVQARRYGSAEVKLSYAAKLAPNWADPLKYWGDALAGEGKRGEALAKYDVALKLAPKWRELQQARAKLAAS